MSNLRLEDQVGIGQVTRKQGERLLQGWKKTKPEAARPDTSVRK